MGVREGPSSPYQIGNFLHNSRPFLDCSKVPVDKVTIYRDCEPPPS